jgi:hypothetical protein
MNKIDEKLELYPNKRGPGSGPMQDWHLFPMPTYGIPCQEKGGISILPSKFLEKIFFYIRNPADFSRLNQTCRYFYAFTSRMYHQTPFAKLWHEQKAMRSKIDNLRGKTGFNGWIHHVSETVKALKTEQQDIQMQIQGKREQKQTIANEMDQTFLIGLKKINAELFADFSAYQSYGFSNNLSHFIGLVSEEDQKTVQELKEKLKNIDLQGPQEKWEANSRKIVRQSSDLIELNGQLSSCVSEWSKTGEMLKGEYLELCKKMYTDFVNLKN